MASTPATARIDAEQLLEGDDGVPVHPRHRSSTTQAIFRAGLRRIAAVEDDLRVVGQAGNPGPDLNRSKKVFRRRPALRSRHRLKSD